MPDRTAHDWGPPLPGQGSARVCRRCGVKELPSSRDPQHPDFACQGIEPSMAAQVVSEYEPIP